MTAPPSAESLRESGRDEHSPAARWVARLGPGKNLLSPRVHLDRRIDSVSPQGREAVILRLKDWLRDQVETVLGPLRAAGHAAQNPTTPAPARALLALLVDEGGIVTRDAVAGALGGARRTYGS